ncbi:MAG TPA: YfhO family protein, partial [Jatrophihabitantaceae bacterium]
RRIDARVQAEGAGYVTVSDAMTEPGWSVTVDGARTPLLVGDHALGTVAVPAGTHTVSFRYRAPGFSAGSVLSVLGLLAIIALLVGDRALRRRRPEPSVTVEPLSSDAEATEPAVEQVSVSKASESEQSEHEPPT